MKSSLLSVLAAVLISSGVAGAELLPVEVGQLQRIEVFPSTVKFTGQRQTMQLVVTGHYADGRLQDLTRACTVASPNPAIVEAAGSVLRPRGDGEADVVVSVGGQSATVKTTVAGHANPDLVSFEFGALAALSKNGCNAGACHGSPSGKGGFRLSLRAFDPKLDALTLVHEDLGRRTNPLRPEDSLLLLKPLMKAPHGGGLQLRPADAAYGVLRDWIAEGCRLDPATTPRCVRLEVYPPSGRVLKRPAHTQQLCVLAHFTDGTVRDVTPLAVYTTSDAEVATVTAGGLVVGADRGETAIGVRYLEHIQTTFLTFLRDIEGYRWNDAPVANYVDEHVHAKLKQLGYLPSETCTDDEFLRRVHLDITGQLPTIEETIAFLDDKAADKRARLIDKLLERPEFSRFWALKWGDLLKLTSAQVGGDAVHKYYRWLENAWATNLPYDKFARELLTATGSTLSNPPANFYRTTTDANDRVETVSQVFLGARVQCAKCHNHPFERWTQDNYYGLAAFFHRVQKKKTTRADEQFVWTTRTGEVTQPRTGQTAKPWLPDTPLSTTDEDDRRRTFADWLVRPENPFFGKVEVNRIWSHLFGRGIVDPPDDFRDSNPPSNAALLDALAKDFAARGFDRKQIVRTILNSRTYQASFRTNDFNRTDTKYASCFQPRLLSAEQLLDAICYVTGTDEKFGTLPPGTKATQLPAPDLAKNEFLKIFGQPERQTVCACERVGESNLGMAIQFFNGPLIYGKLRDANNRFRKLVTAGKSDAEVVTELYLAGLCRRPSEKELAASLAHLNGKPDRLAALEDVGWALLNTNEFLFQH